METKWYESHDNLIELAHWLVDECHITGVKGVLYFFEKPWKWTEEWHLYLAHCESLKGTTPPSPASVLEVGKCQ